MEFPSDVFMRYKEYLKSFDYPYINQMNDTDVRKIFEKENRIFLLTWILMKLVPSYSIRLDKAKLTNKMESTLANIIYENGFCRLAEKDIFVSQNSKMSSEKQIVIFDKIFTMLSLINADNPDKENIAVEDIALKQFFMKPTKEGFENKILHDVNLFPMFGLPKKLTDDQRNVKIDSFKNEIDSLKNRIKEMEITAGEQMETNTSNINTTSHEVIENLTTNLTKAITNFNNNFTYTFTKTSETEIYTQKPELEDCVKQNSEHLSILLEVLEKKQQVNQILRDKGVQEKDNTITNDANSVCILKNYATSEKIIDELKQN